MEATVSSRLRSASSSAYMSTILTSGQKHIAIRAEAQADTRLPQTMQALNVTQCQVR